MDIVRWFDAMGLSVFCKIGTAKAMHDTSDSVITIVMGVITVVAGGIFRDVMASETPIVLHKEVYAIAAFLGALCYVLFYILIADFALLLSVAAAFFVHALGIILNFSLPVPG